MAQVGIWVAFALLLTAYLVLFGILLTVNVSLALFLLGLGVLFYSLFVIIYLTLNIQPASVAHFTPVCSSEFIGGSESTDRGISGDLSGVSPSFRHGNSVKGLSGSSVDRFGYRSSSGLFSERGDEIIRGGTSSRNLIDGSDLTSVNIDLLGSVHGSSGHGGQTGIALGESNLLGGIHGALREARIAGGRIGRRGNISGAKGRSVNKVVPVGAASNRNFTSVGSSDISNNPKRRLRIGSRFN